MLDNRRQSSSSGSNTTSPNSTNNGMVCRMQQEINRRMYIAAFTETVRSTWEEGSSQQRHRNLSGPSSTGPRPSLDNTRALTTPPPGCTSSKDSCSVKERHGSVVMSSSGRDSNHRKLDRSASEDLINGNHHHNSNERGGRGVNSSRYKTELCRPFEENGHCKYGDKCQFAHGMHELRNLSRHPKYKTERCRTFHTIGFCPYGPRCHFIHNEEERVQSKRRQQICAPTSTVPCDDPSNHYDSSTKTICASPTIMSSPSIGRSRSQGGSRSISSSFESVATAPSTPGNMSPVLLSEDKFPSITTFSASDLATQESVPGTDSSPCRHSATIFSFPASDASSSASLLTPLNVQTQQLNFVNNLLDLQMLYNQNQRNNGMTNYSVSANVNVSANVMQDPPVVNMWFADNKLQEELDLLEFNFPSSSTTEAFPAPCSSPELLSDSMGSSSSLEEATTGISNPLDLGRCMRLPIFNQLM